MATAAHGYLQAVRRILEHIETTQLPAVERAAELVATSLLNGGAIFCGDVGHGNEGDFLNRAGGLAALQKFSFGLHLHEPIARCLADRPREEPFDREAETVRFALRASQLRRGDVLVLSSVSGKNVRPIELALACAEAGIHTLGLTSLPYTAQVTSLHPSGRKLCDVVSVLLDIGAPYGDAAVTIPGYEIDLLPVSGVSQIVLGHCVWGRAAELAAERGTPLSVFMSLNRDDGRAWYDANMARYQEKGY